MASLVPQILISLGLSAAGSVLLRNKNKASLQSDSPPTLAKRGSLLPYLVGKRRLGAIAGFVGGRRIVKEDSPSGKKGLFSSPDVDVFYEKGMHILSYPGRQSGGRAVLHQIQKNGKAIFTGPITPDSHPSGSVVSIGKEGSFTIYWGERTQPINSSLGDLTGVYSRHPRLAYVYWDDHRLGVSPTWSQLTYVFELGIQFQLLTQSQQFKESTSVPAGISVAVDSVSGGKILVKGNFLSFFVPGTTFELIDNTAQGDAFFTVDSASLASFAVSPGVAQTFTEIKTLESVSGFSDDGQILLYKQSADSGYNPAHIIAQILFGGYPYGQSLPQENFNIDSGYGSLEALGVRMQQEDLFGSFKADTSGLTVEEALAGILQDIGAFISLNPRTGKYDFLFLRDTTSVPHFSDDFLLEEPEVETDHERLESPQVIYVFEDEERNFADNSPGGFESDGEFNISELFRLKQVRLFLPTNYPTAAQVASRRSQEELGRASSFSLVMHRSARRLMPGMQFTTERTNQRLVCVSKKINQLSSKVEITAIADVISTEAAPISAAGGGGQPPGLLAAETPPAFSIFELPRYLSEQLLELSFPTIRAHEQVINHTYWLSTDNSSFFQILESSSVQTGGVLVAALPSDTDTVVDSGTIEFTPLGPDLTSLVLDLSGDSEGWRSGRQVALINEEVMFLDGVVAQDDKWYLGRVLRGRYNTPIRDHSIGSPVFILKPQTIPTSEQPQYFPGATIYIKAQANAADSVPLSDVPSVSRTLDGIGVTPLAPVGLRARRAAGDPDTNTYAAGGDVHLKWSYHSFSLLASGAGLQPAGNAHGVSPVQGEFRLEFKTVGGTLRGTYFTSQTSFVYTNANMVSDFGFEPSPLRVVITHAESGYESEMVELLIPKT